MMMMMVMTMVMMMMMMVMMILTKVLLRGTEGVTGLAWASVDDTCRLNYNVRMEVGGAESIRTVAVRAPADKVVLRVQTSAQPPVPWSWKIIQFRISRWLLYLVEMVTMMMEVTIMVFGGPHPKRTD